MSNASQPKPKVYNDEYLHRLFAEWAQRSNATGKSPAVLKGDQARIEEIIAELGAWPFGGLGGVMLWAGVLRLHKAGTIDASSTIATLFQRVAQISQLQGWHAGRKAAKDGKVVEPVPSDPALLAKLDGITESLGKLAAPLEKVSAARVNEVKATDADGMPTKTVNRLARAGEA